MRVDLEDVDVTQRNYVKVYDKYIHTLTHSKRAIAEPLDGIVLEFNYDDTSKLKQACLYISTVRYSKLSVLESLNLIQHEDIQEMEDCIVVYIKPSTRFKKYISTLLQKLSTELLTSDGYSLPQKVYANSDKVTDFYYDKEEREIILRTKDGEKSFIDFVSGNKDRYVTSTKEQPVLISDEGKFYKITKFIAPYAETTVIIHKNMNVKSYSLRFFKNKKPHNIIRGYKKAFTVYNSNFKAVIGFRFRDARETDISNTINKILKENEICIS